MDLGKRIKELREKKKLTQEDLGLAVGAKTPRQWGSQLENGKIKSLKKQHAIKLGLLLDVDPLYFYSDEIQVLEEPLIPIKNLANDPLKGNSKKEIIYLLTEENRLLLRENAYLKSLLLANKIEVYNTDNQNETV